ncbi:MAG: glycine cleavage system aminomethyltransferase GcvT [Treponema sp.]|jgi:aminomethyltransferase|nr:glycine cleavage system aminomethyltransferase GcvT [Treponema sp.]
MEKKTPLYAWHESHGGKIVPFAGYLLPVQYEQGVIAEHEAVRNRAGLFDVSHMGEFVVSGEDALDNLQRIATNDFSKMPVGRVRYTLLCNDNGGVIDDLVVCKMGEENGGRYLLVVNAANREKDAAWIRSHLEGSAQFEDISDSLAQIALQGPLSGQILARLAAPASIPSSYYTLIENGEVGGIPCIVSRTGYTGEKGFELYCDSGDAVALWEKLLDAGKDDGLVPCGLGGRDTLRLEAAMPLYGHEMTDEITPFEAALSFAVKMDKPDFIGKQRLVGRETPVRIRVGLRIIGRGISRGGENVFADGVVIGQTTSGSFAPHLKEAIAMALVQREYAMSGQKVEIDVRGHKLEAIVTELPFYKRAP